MTAIPWVALRDEAVPEAVERLLLTVPEWFGRPESNAEYIETSRSKETWTVRDAQREVVGVLLVDRHFPHVAEVLFMVVERTLQGLGIGSALISAIERDARERGVALLEVKTLGPSDRNPDYARTRHFYESVGFLPLEETDLWGEDTPCLIMVKPISSTV
jgi:GNAT superfamily N-acetyltransferase